jgi:arylformamidase
MDLIDISRPLSPATAVWPGDQPVEWNWTARIEDGSSVNLGALSLSVHAGTHVDAPYHVREEGSRTEDLDLSVFIGPAEVVAVDTDFVLPRHVEDVDAPRVLFKTAASAVPTGSWPETITPIHPDTVSALVDTSAVLVGTDAPSVDPLNSTDLQAHHGLIDADIVNVEGLCLADVAPGSYRLMALPLKLQGADAAPVRAVLTRS